MKIRVETSTPGFPITLDSKKQGVTPLELDVPAGSHTIEVWARWTAQAHPSVAGQMTSTKFVVPVVTTASEIRQAIHRAVSSARQFARMASMLYAPPFNLQDTPDTSLSGSALLLGLGGTSTDNSEPVILKWSTSGQIVPLDNVPEMQEATQVPGVGPQQTRAQAAAEAVLQGGAPPASVERTWSITVSPRDVGLIAGVFALTVWLFRRK